MQKKIATPTSRRTVKCPRSEPGYSAPAKKAAWVPSTAIAAMARSGSTSSKRSPAVRIGDHTVSVARPKRGFAPRLAGLAAAGAGLRALYLFTVARHVNGAGDWHFYHWQANLIAEGRGFIEPFQFLFDQHSSPSAGPP